VGATGYSYFEVPAGRDPPEDFAVQISLVSWLKNAKEGSEAIRIPASFVTPLHQNISPF